MRERYDEGEDISFIGIKGMRGSDDKTRLSGDPILVRSMMKAYGLLCSRSSTLTERYPRYSSPTLEML